MRHVSRNNLNEYDVQQVARFNNGLRFDIQQSVCLQTTWTIDEAIRLAMKAEQTISKQGRKALPYRNTVDSNRAPFQKNKQGSDIHTSSSQIINDTTNEKNGKTSTSTSTFYLDDHGKSMKKKTFMIKLIHWSFAD